MSGSIVITSLVRDVEIGVSTKVRVVEVILVQRSLGPQGLSAYMVAVKNGFTGTETEWLNSIMQGPEGKSAYELSGFPGSLEEWLQSLQGDDGIVPEIDIGDTVALFENNLL